MKTISLNEICQQTGLDEKKVHVLVEREWITPNQRAEFDDEDLARIHFIVELERDFGANEAAIPIILHLVDQLHYFRGKLHEIRDHF